MMSESIILLDMVYDKYDIGNFLWGSLIGLSGSYHNWRESACYREYKLYWSYVVIASAVENDNQNVYIEIVDLEEVI